MFHMHIAQNNNASTANAPQNTQNKTSLV